MSDSFIYKTGLFVFISSILVSIIVLLHDEVINDDGVVYVTTALKIIENGVLSLTDPEVLRWGLYPVFIAIVTSVSPFNAEQSALALNTLFFSISSAFYVFILGKLSSDKKVILSGCLVILMAPAMIAYRDYVIRDPGYWAFWLMGVYFFITFWFKPTLMRAFIWTACMFIAALFRLEAIAFLLFLPFILLVKTSIDLKQRFVLVLKSASGVLVVISILLILLLTGGSNSLDSTRLADIPYYLSILPVKLSQSLAVLETHLLNEYSAKYSVSILSAVIIAIVFSKVFSKLTFVYALACFHGFFVRQPQRQLDVSKIIFFILLLNIVILVLFAGKELFLTGRYVIPVILSLLLFAPFSMVNLYDRWHFKGERKLSDRLLFPLMLILIIILFLDAMISLGASKLYLKESGHWIEQQYPEGIDVFSNDSSIYFYAGIIGIKGRSQGYPFFEDEKVNPVVIEHYKAGELIAARVSRKLPEQEKALTAALKIKPFHKIANERGDRVLFFKKSQAYK